MVAFLVESPSQAMQRPGLRPTADRLVGAINSDASVRCLEGPERPLMPLEERVDILRGLRWADRVVPFDESNLEVSLRTLHPDVHAKGPDYTPGTVPEAPIDRELGIEIAICGDPKDHSTAELLAAVQRSSRSRS